MLVDTTSVTYPFDHALDMVESADEPDRTALLALLVMAFHAVPEWKRTHPENSTVFDGVRRRILDAGPPIVRSRFGGEFVPRTFADDEEAI